MKSKWYLFASIFQMIVGIAAIGAFMILALHKEAMGRWFITLLLAIAFLVIGVMGIVDYYKK